MCEKPIVFKAFRCFLSLSSAHRITRENLVVKGQIVIVILHFVDSPFNGTMKGYFVQIDAPFVQID